MARSSVMLVPVRLLATTRRSLCAQTIVSWFFDNSMLSNSVHKTRTMYEYYFRNPRVRYLIPPAEIERSPRQANSATSLSSMRGMLDEPGRSPEASLSGGA
jgi:hypothetical protein